MRQQQHPRRIVASLTGVLVPALWLFRASPNLTGTGSQCLFEEGGPIALAGDRSAPFSLMSSSSSEQELRGLLVFLSDCGWLLCRGGPGLRAFQEPSGGLNGKRNQRSRRPSDRCDISVEYERLRAGRSRGPSAADAPRSAQSHGRVTPSADILPPSVPLFHSAKAIECSSAWAVSLWRLWKGEHVCMELCIPIQSDVPPWASFRKGFPQLLDDPLRGRVLGYVEVQDLPASVFDDKEAVQHPERHRRDSEKIQRRDHLAVIGQECQPTSARITAPPDTSQIASDGSFRDDETQLQEFSLNSGRAPSRISFRQAPYERISAFAFGRPPRGRDRHLQ